VAATVLSILQLQQWCLLAALDAVWWWLLLMLWVLLLLLLLLSVVQA
jgi:hypothetical protein